MIKKTFILLILTLCVGTVVYSQPMSSGYVGMSPWAHLIGKKFIDVTQPDMKGKAHKLSEYCGKGKYVLVDFWASWCGPCMNEMPNVKACWEKYRSKGFTVVGISLDRNAAAWKGAVTKGGYAWTHLSDLKHFENSAAQTYNVQYIPWNFLVDPKGKIIAVELTGANLESTLKKYLAPKAAPQTVVKSASKVARKK